MTQDLLERIVRSVGGLDGELMLARRDSDGVARALAAAEAAATVAGIRGTPSFEAGLTGGLPEPLAIRSLGPDDVCARLDELLGE